jgi:drug/metabolite transporter (DMT)-like permease
MTAVLLGLTSALGWGGADFLAGLTSRQIGSFRTLFYTQFVGFITVGVYALATGLFASLEALPMDVYAAAVLAALLNIVSSFCLYRAFEIGMMAVVSPITASYGALTAVFAFFSGERLPAVRVIGVIAAVVGVLLTAAVINPEAFHQRSIRRGVGWAITGAIGYGFVFWLFGFYVTPHMGGLLPVFIIRGLTIIVLGAIALLLRRPLGFPVKHDLSRVLMIGVCDTTAYIAILSGTTVGAVSIVTVLSSLYTTVTVFLAALLLRERLHISQWIGVALILTGIILVSV